MEFSPVVPCSHWLARWSPDGALLAHAVGARVVIRRADSLKVLSAHCCLDAVDSLFWSPTSEFVAAAVTGMAVTHVFCVSDEKWTAKISEGPIGLSWSRFSPDGRHVLSQAEFNVKLTIWSLASKQVRYVKFAECLAFSPDGERMAVAEKASSGPDPADHPSGAAGVSMAIYACADWQELSRFPTRCPDPAGVAWEPRRGDKVAVWNGALLYAFQVFTSAGHLLMEISCMEMSGVRAFAWSPCGQLIAAGGLGGDEVRLFNALNFSRMFSFKLSESVSGDDFASADCAVFEEREVAAEDIDGKIIQEWLSARDVVYEGVSARPFPLPRKKGAVACVAEVCFSPDGRRLACRDESRPGVVWVWDVQRLCLAAALVHRNPVTCLSWEPAAGDAPARLAVLTSSAAPVLFVWSSLGALVLRVPVSSAVGGDAMSPTKVRWNPQGRGAMCLVGRDGFVCSKILKRAPEKQRTETEETNSKAS